ncbi:AMP-binding protein [Hymenobacter psoromatis]|uniref:AMP-binding protein n=1 Tax=Hymenobacter psoromatis TaxID=1484116 RepID=UPI001CC152C8|nr:AMP-binding protein [Hymenobacter psoromatis]
MHPNFAERLFSSLLAHPARPVLRWPDPRPGASATTLSGAELLGRVHAWQLALERAGPLPPGAPVLLAQPGSPELVAALLAVLGLGAVPVLPPAGATARQLLALLRTERIGHVATTPGARRWLAGPGRLLGYRCVAATPTAGEFSVPTPLLRPVPLGQPALVSHSSGSASGRPTAVRRSHAVLQQQHEALRRQFPPWAGQRDFPLFSNVILHNLAVGALSVVPDLAGGLARLVPGRVLAQLAAEQVQTLTGNVFYFNTLLEELRRQPATFPAVRALGVGGSPVPEQLLAALRPWFPGATLHVIYGASEAEPIAVRSVAGAALDPRRGYCVGPLVAGLRVRLGQPAPVWLPPALTPPPVGGPAPAPTVAGEILVAGPHVARPAGAPEYLTTGDHGYFDTAGQLWLVGRRGAAGLVRGVGHYQLEHYLRQLPGVDQVAARTLAGGGQFELFVVGSRPVADVRAAVAAAFGEGLLGPVRYRPRLPVDGRHFSKIRYDLLG